MKFAVRIFLKLVPVAFLAALIYLAIAIGPSLIHLWDIWELKNQNPDGTALIRQRSKEYTAKKQKIKTRWKFVPYEEIPQNLKDAVRLAEDGAFFSHSGVDLHEFKEAVKQNLKAGRYKRGASTISQQLVKNLYLSTKKNLSRKAAELILTVALEHRLSKARIFELYLNYIEWGQGVYGCEAASLAYFEKSCRDLSLEEIIRLTSITVNPRRYGPYTKSEFIKKRRERIAQRLLHAKKISPAEYKKLL